MWRTTLFWHFSGQPPGIKTLISYGPVFWRKRFLDTRHLNFGTAFPGFAVAAFWKCRFDWGDRCFSEPASFERGARQKGLLSRSKDEPNRGQKWKLKISAWRLFATVTVVIEGRMSHTYVYTDCNISLASREKCGALKCVMKKCPKSI